jgi:hypothetical protein
MTTILYNGIYCIWHTYIIKQYTDHCLSLLHSEIFAPWFSTYFTISQLTPCVGQVGTRAEVRGNSSPSYSLWTASNLCGSDCSPRVLLAIRAVTFNLTCTGKMSKILKWKVCQLSPLSPTGKHHLPIYKRSTIKHHNTYSTDNQVRTILINLDLPFATYRQLHIRCSFVFVVCKM